MTLSEIASVTGLPGLYKIVTRRNDGLIVTSLSDQKTIFVSGRTHLFTTLDSITLYTNDEPVELKAALQSIRDKEKEHAVPDGKNDAETKAWMEVILPSYDKEKVYVSDMKKLAKWYLLLSRANLLDELLADPKGDKETEASTEEETTKTKKEKTAKEEKPKKSVKPKADKNAKAAKAHTKPAPGAKKVTAPRKAQ